MSEAGEYTTSVRFLLKGGVFTDTDIPEGADEYHILVSGLEEFTVFSFRGIPKLFYYDSRDRSPQVRTVPIYGGLSVCSIMRAYASLLVHLGDGRIVEVTQDGGQLHLQEQKTIFSSVKSLAAPEAQFEVIHEGREVLFLFQLTMEDGTHAMVFQDGNELVTRQEKFAYSFFCRGAKDQLLAIGYGENGELISNTHGPLPQLGINRLLLGNEYLIAGLDGKQQFVVYYFNTGVVDKFMLKELGTTIYGATVLPYGVFSAAGATQFVHLVINDGNIRVYDFLYRNWHLEQLGDGKPAGTIDGYDATSALWEDEDLCIDRFGINRFVASNCEKPLLSTETFTLHVLDTKEGRQENVELLSADKGVQNEFAERCYMYQLITRDYERRVVSMYDVCISMVLRADHPYQVDYSSFTTAAPERLLISDGSMVRCKGYKPLIDETTRRAQVLAAEQEKRSLQKRREEEERRKQHEKEMQEQQKKALRDECIDGIEKLGVQMLKVQQLDAGPIQLVKTSLVEALDLVNRRIEDRVELQRLHQRPGTVLLDNSIRNKRYAEVLNSGRVGEFIISTTTGSRLGYVVDGKIHVLEDQMIQSPALLDYGAQQNNLCGKILLESRICGKK